MAKPLQLGSATAKPGTLQYGQWNAFAHPTGHVEWLPVIIAQGEQDGPCLWLTAGIHGTEHAGPTILYKLLTQDLVDRLRGTIVAIPALSPVGLRTAKYVPHTKRRTPTACGRPAGHSLTPTSGRPARPPSARLSGCMAR